ncbi:heavy metal-associated domain protein [Aeromicrobium marinum DSM 15272]|uniref:Heavy metal-associated domain protein n=1 Tax=Aeromicrobium marinum DSM 15272 TaxID=585531 RepID=E2SCB8_9ACTN|nr:hypothetical protein [Aeromicrobium marinum]EFQ82871.1 heavy metal-associated domain protein [Aeromicrobium marinum DSM 15272]
MRASTRLGLYGATLVAIFAVAFAAAGAVVPQEYVEQWAEQSDDRSGGYGAGHDTDQVGTRGPSAGGLTSESGGYRLAGVSSPSATGTEGELLLTVLGPDGEPVTDFEESHDKELHLIVVRTDGSGFRHVHPERDTDGQWSIPWQWDAAGGYRAFAEFEPAATGETVTLSTVTHVRGDFAPSNPSDAISATRAGGYDVSIDGEIVSGAASEVVVTITRDGRPVTDLEPYLGAFGHLVALREGDLAYLHVHPRGEPAQAGGTSGPDVAFDVTASTPGRYLLYLDFQIGGQVHTAAFVLDATTGTSSPMSGHGAGSHDENEHEDTTREDDHDH